MKDLMIVLHNMFWYASCASCALFVALVYLLPDSRWQYHELALWLLFVVSIVLCFAAVGAEQLYRDRYDEQYKEMR